jgi:hypothetical protein
MRKDDGRFAVCQGVELRFVAGVGQVDNPVCVQQWLF